MGGDSRREGNLISANQVGIQITGAGTTGTQVLGNRIGTDVRGTSALGNLRDGIVIESAENSIGHSLPGMGNVISGNWDSGIRITGANATDNSVVGNFIGTDISGTLALGNGVDGVRIETGAKRNRVGTDGDTLDDAGERNVISGQGQFGVNIVGAGTNENIVAGNLIGTDYSGTDDVGNAWGGVRIADGAQANRVGTDGNGSGDWYERNVISANDGPGVTISGPGTSANVVAGNFIGTEITGQVGLPNAATGITITAGAQANRIGTDGNGVADAAERNVISGNAGDGVAISGAGTTFNVVAGNFLGTDATGTVGLGNAAQRRGHQRRSPREPCGD